MDIFDHQYEVADGVSDRLAIAIRKIEFTRKYTMSLLEDLVDEDWYWSPESFCTHIAWQVGHIAMSHYGLTLFRQRGRADGDSELMSGKFRKLFMKGTQPKREREAYPSPQEILEVLEKVRKQTHVEIASFDGELDESIDAPHAAYGTRYGALLFVADHEMLHAGQIGMLRRLMGKESLR